MAHSLTLLNRPVTTPSSIINGCRAVVDRVPSQSDPTYGSISTNATFLQLDAGSARSASGITIDHVVLDAALRDRSGSIERPVPDSEAAVIGQGVAADVHVRHQNRCACYRGESRNVTHEGQQLDTGRARTVHGIVCDVDPIDMDLAAIGKSPRSQERLIVEGFDGVERPRGVVEPLEVQNRFSRFDVETAAERCALCLPDQAYRRRRAGSAPVRASHGSRTSTPRPCVWSVS